jgi:hypothetical protein
MPFRRLSLLLKLRRRPESCLPARRAGRAGRSRVDTQSLAEYNGGSWVETMVLLLTIPMMSAPGSNLLILWMDQIWTMCCWGSPQSENTLVYWNSRVGGAAVCTRNGAISC